MSKKIEGIICAMLTPHNKDGSVMRQGIRALVDRLIEDGINVLFPTGTAGEGPILTMEAKKEVISSVLDAANGRVPVTPGIACPTTEETIALGRFCDDLGTDAVVVVTPWYYRLTDQALYDHYAAISQSVESPIIAYKIPQACVNDISMGLLERLARLDGIAGIKDSSGDMVWLSKAIALYGDRLRFFGGNDRLILPCLAAGAVGHVSGSSNAFAAEVVDTYRHFKRGDIASSRAAQQRLLRLLMLLPENKENSALREALRMKGFDIGEPLDPLGPLTREESEALRKGLSALSY